MRNSWGEYTFHLTRIGRQPTIFSGRCETRFLEKAAHLAAAISSCESPAPNFPTKNHMSPRMGSSSRTRTRVRSRTRARMGPAVRRRCEALSDSNVVDAPALTSDAVVTSHPPAQDKLRAASRETHDAVDKATRVTGPCLPTNQRIATATVDRASVTADNKGVPPAARTS
jgi:hypothetical protein